jgi:hypothetical protein
VNVIEELQAAVADQVVDWTAFPDRAEAYAVGVHGGIGYVLEVRHMLGTRYWNVIVRAGTLHAEVRSSAAEALDAANQCYALFADVHRHGEVA